MRGQSFFHVFFFGGTARLPKRSFSGKVIKKHNFLVTWLLLVFRRGVCFFATSVK